MSIDLCFDKIIFFWIAVLCVFLYVWIAGIFYRINCDDGVFFEFIGIVVSMLWPISLVWIAGYFTAIKIEEWLE